MSSSLDIDPPEFPERLSWSDELDEQIVYVYGINNKINEFSPVSVLKLKCTECNASYESVDENGESRMWWNLGSPAGDFVECECGEQYFTTEQ